MFVFEFVKFVGTGSYDPIIFRSLFNFVDSVGLVLLFNLFDRLISKFEKVERAHIHNFLEITAKG